MFAVHNRSTIKWYASDKYSHAHMLACTVTYGASEASINPNTAQILPCFLPLSLSLSLAIFLYFVPLRIGIFSWRHPNWLTIDSNNMQGRLSMENPNTLTCTITRKQQTNRTKQHWVGKFQAMMGCMNFNQCFAFLFVTNRYDREWADARACVCVCVWMGRMLFYCQSAPMNILECVNHIQYFLCHSINIYVERNESG